MDLHEPVSRGTRVVIDIDGDPVWIVVPRGAAPWPMIEAAVRRFVRDPQAALEPTDNPMVFMVDDVPITVEVPRGRARAHRVGGVGLGTTMVLEEEEEFPYPDEAELEGAVIIQDSGGGYAVGADGKYLDTFPDWDRALSAANSWMDRNQYWPNLYYINDHGNVTLMDSQGAEIASWV